jgi:TPR repeat protein
MRGVREAWRSGRYKRAHKLLIRALKNGNVTAAWYLGHLYRTGRGVDQNKGKAFEYYRQVWLEYNSLQPYDNRFLIAVDSLVRVADGYRDGIPASGIAKNPNRAYNLYLTASGFSHPGAEHGLAMMFLKGDGVRRKPKRALGWLRSAARKGYAPSRTILGDLHWQGRYVRKDRVKAIMWYLLAQRTARPEDYPQVYKRLDAMLAQASTEDQAAAQALATKWEDHYAGNKALLPVAD